jgi:drug/metabolite transporter (DMT)-like permease
MMKWFVMEDLHPVQLLAVRTWITFTFFVIMLIGQHRKRVISQRWKPQLMRGLAGSLAPIFFFLSLRELPLAEATALFFCSTFFMVILSILFLHEQVGVHRWMAVVIGFSGILLITRPGTELFRIEALYAILASLFYSIMIVSGRWLSRTDSTLSLVFYFNLALLLVTGIALPWLWQAMDAWTWGAVAIMAILTFIAHVWIAQAFKSAPVAIIAPFEYSAMVWATLIGFLVWGDLPDAFSFTGIFIIIGSGLYIIAREQKLI